MSVLKHFAFSRVFLNVRNISGGMTMKLIAIAMLAASLAAYAETEEKINKSFKAQPGGQLVVDVDFGSIEVTPSDGSDITVDVVRKVHRGGKEAEAAFLKERPVTLSQDGNTLTVRSRAESTHWRGGQWRGTQRTEGKYTIRVPAKFNTDVRTSGGSIALSGLTGEAKAKTSGGSIKLAELRGNVNAHTSGGSIRARDVEGPLSVKTSGGAIDIENAKGKVDALTSGGSVSASFQSPISDEVELKTSGGGVTLKVPESSAFDLDASTSGGGVSSDLAVKTEGKPKRTSLRGPVNGGGKPVVLRTSGGSVRIKKA
jgi:DUF4097 and DUF4098 domain-containing protein YvlB